MRAQWGNGKLYIELDEKLEGEPLLKWLQLMGTLVPHTIQGDLRALLSNWHGQRYLTGKQAVVEQKAPEPLPSLKTDCWDDEKPETD
jgi:hypothetical protein